MKPGISIAAILLIILHTACTAENRDGSRSNAVRHTLWDQLLKKHVPESGLANYAGFKKDSATLREYLDLLQANPPDASRWSRAQQLAYWINAYNAFTVDLVLKHYPIKSIKDIGSVIQIPFINTPWDISFIRIGGEKMDLNHIEHGILRKRFDEPRIHFAINCASVSCPVLLPEAYTPENLEQQLHERAVAFINDSLRNDVGRKSVRLSKIFRWFGGDFTDNGTLIEYLNRYSRIQIADDAAIEFLEYDWSLNDVDAAHR
jgi:hypothetical protein